MQNCSLKSSLTNTIYLGLIVTTTLLPVAPMSAIAVEVGNDTTTVALDDQNKTQVPEVTPELPVSTTPVETIEKAEVPDTPKSSDTSDTSNTSEVSDIPEISATAETTDTPEISDTAELQEATPEDESEGMSTGMKYTLGVGGAVVALVGIAALASGGSSDSTPTPPTTEQMVGPWSANASSVDGRTYTGTYTLYAGGSHSYDIYVSDGNHKVGTGAWKLVGYDLEIRNYSGSTYRGTFAEGVKNTVTTYTTDGRWKDVLTK